MAAWAILVVGAGTMMLYHDLTANDGSPGWGWLFWSSLVLIQVACIMAVWTDKTLLKFAQDREQRLGPSA